MCVIQNNVSFLLKERILLFPVKKLLDWMATIRRQRVSKIPVKMKAVLMVSSKSTVKTSVGIVWE